MKKKSKVFDKKSLKKSTFSPNVKRRAFRRGFPKGSLTIARKLFFPRLRNNIIHERKRYFFIAHEFGHEFTAAAC